MRAWLSVLSLGHRTALSHGDHCLVRACGLSISPGAPPRAWGEADRSVCPRPVLGGHWWLSVLGQSGEGANRPTSPGLGAGRHLEPFTKLRHRFYSRAIWFQSAVFSPQTAPQAEELDV